MCGVPVWDDDSHINLLVAAGHRVAVCEMCPGDRRNRREIYLTITPTRGSPAICWTLGCRLG
jgi:DNA mismatch repair ATPase MutS